MRLKVASRKSDLARWQAVQIARALERTAAKPSIEFIFKSSLGDDNLDLPLTGGMGVNAKGVFTEDFYEDLVSGRCDLVVHSWKDLPVEERADTCIALTLARADVRDVLLVPEAVWQSALATGRLEVLTSSPRRVYNLSACLSSLLPGQPRVEFFNVRGNVPTRLKKMHDERRALVLAKAGLDRLIEAEREGFLALGPGHGFAQSQDAGVLSRLSGCRFQVLPVSLNPPAPAQGALAVEVARQNEPIQELCAALIDERTFACVQQERETLRRYGGGCHQKIGVVVLPRAYGVVHALRGLTEQGEELRDWRLENSTPWTRASSRDQVFPLEPRQNSWFARRQLAVSSDDLAAKEALFIARADALPEGFCPDPAARQKVWCAGVQTWVKLAALGVWVNGCHDGLGEQEDPGIDLLAGPAAAGPPAGLTSGAATGPIPGFPGRPAGLPGPLPGLSGPAAGGPAVVSSLRWTKLTHSQAGGPGALATYELVAIPKAEAPDLAGKTHFFWLSRTSFERARHLYPREIAAGHNACGPGVTYDFLQRQTQLKHPVKVFIGLEQFLRETLP